MERIITFGVVLYKTPLRDLTRLARSAATAAEVAGVPCRFLAVDNSRQVSAETFVEATSGMLPAELLPAQGNVGFANGQNRLMTHAFGTGTTHYVTVNPDGFLHPNALRAMLARCAQRYSFALVEARQFPNEHPKIYDFDTFDTPWSSGACLMVPKLVYDRIGPFDPGFFMYCEDVDYSWRARAASAPCVLAPDALFFHDVVDRAQDDNARWHMALSMKRLLSKWGDGAPHVELSRQLAKMLADAPAAVLRAGSSSTTPIDDPKRHSIADFTNKFGFAPFRWQ